MEESPQEETLPRTTESKAIPGPPQSPPPSMKSLAEGISASKEEVPQEELNVAAFKPASVEKLKKQLRTVRRIQRRYAPQKKEDSGSGGRGSKTGPPPPFPPPPVAYDLNKPPGLPLSVIMQTPPPPATPPPEMLVEDDEEEEDIDSEEEAEEQENDAAGFRLKSQGKEKMTSVDSKEGAERFVYNYDETVMTVKKMQYEQQAASIEQQYAKYQPDEEVGSQAADDSIPPPSSLPRYNVDDTVVNVAAGASIVAANEVQQKLSKYESSSRTSADIGSSKPPTATATESNWQEGTGSSQSKYDEADTVMTVERGYTRNAFEKVVSTYQPEPSPTEAEQADEDLTKREPDMALPGFSVDDTTMTVQSGFPKAAISEVVKRYTPPQEASASTEAPAGDEGKELSGFDEAETVMTVERGYTRNAFEKVVSTYQPEPSPTEEKDTVAEEEDDKEVAAFSLDDTVMTVQKGFSKASVEAVVDRYTPPPPPMEDLVEPVETREVYDDDSTTMTIQKGFSRGEVAEVLKTYSPVATAHEEAAESKSKAGFKPVEREDGEATEKDDKIQEEDEEREEEGKGLENEGEEGSKAMVHEEASPEEQEDEEDEEEIGEKYDYVAHGSKASTEVPTAVPLDEEGTREGDSVVGLDQDRAAPVTVESDSPLDNGTSGVDAEGTDDARSTGRSSSEASASREEAGKALEEPAESPTVQPDETKSSDGKTDSASVKSHVTSASEKRASSVSAEEEEDSTVNRSVEAAEEDSQSAATGARGSDVREKSTSEHSGYQATDKSETSLTDDGRVTSLASDDGFAEASETGSAFASVAPTVDKIEASSVTEEPMSSTDESVRVRTEIEAEKARSVSGKASASSGASASSAPAVYFNYDDTVATVAKRTPEAESTRTEEGEEVTATFNYDETVMKIGPKQDAEALDKPAAGAPEAAVRFDYNETVMKIDKEKPAAAPSIATLTGDVIEESKPVETPVNADGISETLEEDESKEDTRSTDLDHEETSERGRTPASSVAGSVVDKNVAEGTVSVSGGVNDSVRPARRFTAEVSEAESLDSDLRKPPSISGATADARDMFRSDGVEAAKKQQRRAKRVSFSEEETSTIESRKVSVADSKASNKSSSSAKESSLVHAVGETVGEDNAVTTSGSADGRSGGSRSVSSSDGLPVSDYDNTGGEETRGSVVKAEEPLASIVESQSATSEVIERELNYGDSSSLSRSDSQAPSAHPVSSKSSVHIGSVPSEGDRSRVESSPTTLASGSSQAQGDGLKEVESQSTPPTQGFVLFPPAEQKPAASVVSSSEGDSGFVMQPELKAETPLDKAVAAAAPLSSSSGTATTLTSTSGEESEEIFGPPPAVPPPPTKPPPPSTSAPGFVETVPPRKPPPGYFTYNYPPQLEEQERLKHRMRQALRERNRAMMLERTAQEDTAGNDGEESFSIDGLHEKQGLHYVLLNVLRREWSERIEVQQYYSTTVRKLRHELETSDRSFAGVVPLAAFRHALHKCLGFKQRDVNRIVCFLGTKQGLVGYPPLLAALDDFASELIDGALVNAKPPLVAGKQNPSVVVYAALRPEYARAKLRQFARWINGLKGFRERQMDLGVLLEGISDGGLLYKLVTVLEQRRNRHFRFRTRPRTAMERIEMTLRHVGLQAPRPEQLFRGEIKPVLSLLGHLLSVYVFQKPRYFQKVLSWFDEVLVCYGKDVPLQLTREPHRGLWATFGSGDAILCVLHYYLGTAVVDLSTVYENPVSAADIKSNWYRVSRLLLRCGLPVPLTMKEILCARLSDQDMLLLMLVEVRNRFKSAETALTPSSFRTILSPGTKQRRKHIVNVFFKGEDKVFSSSRDYMSDEDLRKHQLRRKYIAKKLRLGDSMDEHTEQYTDCLSAGDSASLSSEDLRDIEQELSSYFRVRRRFSVSLEGSLEPCDVYVENGDFGPNVVWEHVTQMDRKGYIALDDVAMCEMCTEATDERLHYILVQFQHGHFSAIHSSGGYKEMRIYANYETGDEVYGVYEPKEADLLRLFASLLKLLENKATLTLAI